MKRLVSIILLCYSMTATGQVHNELQGDFGYSTPLFYRFKLSLRDSGNFVLTISSDIGSSKTVGKWTVEMNTVRLVPVEFFRQKPSSMEWKKSQMSSADFQYKQIKIITKDRLFFESNDDHIHIDRLPTLEDGPYSIAFPLQKFKVADSMDSTKIARILDRLSSWPFDYPFRIELTAQTSGDDAKVDSYIGLKRCREIMKYLADKLNIGTAGFSIRDIDTFNQRGNSVVEVQIIHKYER